MILAWVDQSLDAKSNGAFLIGSFIDHRPKHGHYRQPCSMADKTWQDRVWWILLSALGVSYRSTAL